MKFAIRHSLFAILLISGCSGSAKVNFISINTSAIDPPPVEPWRFNAHQCSWWLDDAGEFNIVMQCKKGNLLLGALGEVEINLSFALDGPPAGSGRDYVLKQHETRAILLSPAGNQRFIIHSGICSVITGKDGTYTGSFRLWMTPLTELNVLSLLPQRRGPVLCFGTFHAIHDERNGRPIRERSESYGWLRPPRKPPGTSRPTTVPASQ